ncbi:RNA polymerase sigma factor (sigma-70 family) [Bradyrhizobium sp. USDA 4524]|uniref:sigma-70 family RNA polymerase sigma factor n=1 Tax=unclassified Bradyrhizobium TaxID=2631580 RepID=UPI00209D6473|nr:MULTISPECIES: sigma-70 family RNA polymerase sigma factor [unclassified Bradyrhizobium]MCP1838771.1 RNA polymerase sigma factor (sigma-70 family) [Bradyrhizobium sp. USDA 4538]MCP1899337.1 RNA polymerase sigma factor (sigma-70 family) [Bradyrhizobium sp. USDA 4537]MCP1986551.1 RNA polymerase sigma factor (sigma-70 family) [Bradyrhizobium sp. USDA 4539]
MRKYLRVLVCLLCLGLTTTTASAQALIVARAVSRAIVRDTAAIVASRNSLSFGSSAMERAMQATASQRRLSLLDSTALSTSVFVGGDMSSTWARSKDNDVTVVDPFISSNVKEFCAEKADTPEHNRASKALIAALNTDADKRLRRYPYLGLEADDVSSEMMMKILARCPSLSALPDGRLRAYVLKAMRNLLTDEGRRIRWTPIESIDERDADPTQLLSQNVEYRDVISKLQDSLNSKQRQVLEGLVAGHDQKAIAAEINNSTRWVRTRHGQIQTKYQNLSTH